MLILKVFCIRGLLQGSSSGSEVFRQAASYLAETLFSHIPSIIIILYPDDGDNDRAGNDHLAAWVTPHLTGLGSIIILMVFSVSKAEHVSKLNITCTLCTRNVYVSIFLSIIV